MIYLAFFLALLICIALAIFSFQKISFHILNTPPTNNPKSFLANSKQKTSPSLVTIGDSITHGSVSANYSNLIANEVGKHGYTTVNAGLNADLAYSVVQRIDDIIACQPKIVTLLIGTNDVMSTFDNRIEQYWQYKRIPKGRHSSEDFYLKNLEIIIDKIKIIPDVKIFIFSLPILGEDLVSPYNEKVVTYSQLIKKLSLEKNITYLPLNESMREYIQANPNKGSLEFGKEKLASILAVMRNKYLKHDWNSISKSNNLQLTSETIHLNELGADMVAKLALEKILPLMRKS